MNEEEQYSIWPDAHPVPAGWRALDRRGTKRGRLDFIDCEWTALRPPSLPGQRRAALDRLGARPVLVTVLVGQALAATGLAWAHSSATAVAVMVLQGASLGPSNPAYTTMIGGLGLSPEQQQRAFGWTFTTVNAAIGVGGAIGGAVVDVRHAATIQALFLGNALATAVCAGLVARLPNHR